MLVLLGLAGFAVTYLIAGSVAWGPPGTDNYQVYQTANRVVGLPLVVLAVGMGAVSWTKRHETGWLGWVA